MNLDKRDEALLKRTMQEPVWDVLTKALGQEIERIQAEEITGLTAFDTLKTLHLNQGRVDGLKNFFDKLEHGALK